MAAIQYVGIDHVVLVVTDIDRTLDFYVNKLNMSVERTVGGRLFHLRCGNTLIDIVTLPDGVELAEPASRGIGHLCLNIHGSMASIAAALAADGVEPSSPPSVKYGAGGYRTSMYVKDPDGYVIELRVDRADQPVELTSEDFRKIFIK